MLVLEDNAALRRIVGHRLRELGYRVLEPENAVEAVTVLEQQNVDLLFTDVIMPGETTGFEPTRTALARWPALRAVLTSGFPQAR